MPFWALRDITFKVEPGEVVGVVGRNGAGKSTLLKVISRITPPTEGRIRLVGRVGSLLEVGTGFHPELTGRENAFLSGAILGMSQAEIRRRFDEIVAFAEIEQFLDTPVELLSVRLSTTDGQLAASARVDQPLQLVVRYHVERPLSFRCAAILSTQGAVAFTSIEPKELMRVEPGDYESTLLLPPDLLTEGQYTVTVSLVASRGVTERLAAAVDAVSFLVSDPMNGSSARGDYAERLSGLVCPRLTWSMLRVSSETALSAR